jgi:hypothetical protein
MNSSPARTRWFFLILTALVLAAGFMFWQTDLTADPPMHYTGLGQSLSTDPAQYTWHARNQHLFGEWDPFDYPRWTVYQHSLTSAVAWLWFSVAGVSLEQSNMVGLLLSFGALIFLLLALRRHSPWLLSTVTLAFVMNVSLITYGRLSYLENGLVFIAAVMLWVYSWWGDRLWGVVACGALAAVATFAGKLFGSLLLPVLIVTIFASGSANRLKMIIAGVLAFFAASLALIAAFYGSDLSAAFAYAGEQSYGLRGFPAGLSSPWDFFEHLIAYGYKNRLLYQSPDIYMFMLVAAGMFVMLPAGNSRLGQLSRVARFSMFWMVIVVAGLMPLNYSPLRYALFLIPAVIVSCYTMVDTIRNRKLPIRLSLDRLQMIVLFAASWYFLFHLIGNVFHFNTQPPPVRLLTWSTLPGAVVLTYLVWLVSKRMTVLISGRWLTVGLLLVVSLSILANTFRVKRWHIEEENYNIIEASADLPKILGENAIISGPYGPVLTSGNNLRSFIHLFGVANLDSTLFDRYPITHLAVDFSNWEASVKAFPALGNIQPITSYWIRDIGVNIYNISKIFANPEALRYQETDYERAVGHFRKAANDSALFYLESAFEQAPKSKAVSLLLLELLLQQVRTEEARQILTTQATAYPTDFNAQVQLARFLQIVSIQTGDKAMLDLAFVYYQKSTDLNRYKGNQIVEMYNAIYRQTTGFAPEDLP